MSYRIIIASAALMLMWSVGAEAQHRRAAAAAAPTSAPADSSSYVCPMHPKETSSQPGNCKTCGMALVSQKRTMTKAAASSVDSSAYACPMHPKVTSPYPGKCPQCGMDLVKQKPKRDTVTKDELIAAGLYNCCVKKPCDECYKDHQSCNCYRSAKTTKQVCEECGKGWKNGEGRVPGVHADSLKAVPHKH